MSSKPDINDYGRMANFMYQMHHGHIVVTVEGRPYLLDTGSPFSVGYEPINIGGRSFEVQQSYMGVTCGYLMENIGVPIEGMIGADIMQEFTVCMYASERMIQFTHLPPVGDIVIPLQDFMGVPIFCVQVAGQVRRMFFDTGAPMSYLLPQCLADKEAEGRHEDFYPLVGNFMTSVYALDVNIGGSSRKLRFGELPHELEALLEAGAVQGIIGTEMLKHFGICLSLKEGVMRLETPYSDQLGLRVAS
ncbi:MAG: hypothetical protein ABJ308_07210 [Halieaceae bacterium]